MVRSQVLVTAVLALVHISVVVGRRLLKENINTLNNGSELNIGIVGGGASGLTLAYALENLGHKVTVYESNDRVGGKVFSPMIDGQIFDVGGVLIDSPFTTMLLETECALPRNDTYEFSVWNPDEQGSAVNLSLVAGFTEYVNEIPAWFQVYNTYKYLQEDPMAFFQYEKNKPLQVPFDEFIRENGIEVLGQAFRNSYVLYGYGFGEDVPALYILKFMIRVLDPASLATVVAGTSSGEPLRFPSVILPGGGQALFECLASTLGDVRLNTTVKAMARGEGGPGQSLVRIETDQGSAQLYDRVVITTDLMQALSFLDAREEESSIFSLIRHNLYTSSIIQGVAVPDFPNDNVGIDCLIFPPNMYQNRSMFPQGISSKPFPDVSSVAGVTYQYDVSAKSKDVIVQGGSSLTPIVDGNDFQFLKQDSENFMNASGIKFQNIARQYTWPTYFPHFGSKDLRDGAYERLASLQGKQGIYYAGSIFNFETIQGVTDFALALAQMIQ